MKMAEIFQVFADLAKELEQSSASNQQQPVVVNVFNNGTEPAATTASSQEEPLGKFVPPLQTKIELMKRSEGLPNSFDQKNDDVEDIKKLAGVSSQSKSIAAEDDGPFEG